MKLKIKRTIGYGTYSNKELKSYLKEQATLTLVQVIKQLEAWQAQGTHLVSGEAIDALREQLLNRR